MAAAQGYAAQLGIDTADPVTARFDFVSESLICDENFINANGLRGTRSHSVTRVRQGNRRVGGQLVLQPNAAELALLLPWCLGANASGTTYALADTLQTRYVTVDRISKVFTYDTVGVDRMTLRATVGQPLDMILDLVGKDETVANSGTFPSLSIDTATGPFVLTDAAMTIAGTSRQMPEFEFTLNNFIDRDRFLNTTTLTSITAQDRECTFRTRLPYGDASAAYASGAGGVAVVATFTNGTVSISLSLVKVCFPRISPQVEGRREIWMPMMGRAYESGGTKELVVTLDSTV